MADKYAQLQAALDEQAAQKENAKKMLQDELLRTLENKPNAVDLSAAAAFVDSTDGSKLSPAFANAGRKDELADRRAAELTGELAGIESDAADEKIAALKQGIAGDQVNKQNAIEGRFDRSQTRAWFNDIRTDFDKERKALDESDRQFSGIEKAIADGSYEKIKGQLSNFARVVNAEKGVLTDSDLGRTFIDTVDSIFLRFGSRFDKSGKMRPEDLQNLASSIEDARKIISSTASERLAQKRETYTGNPDSEEALAQHEKGKNGLVSGTINKAQNMATSKTLAEWRAKNAKQLGGPKSSLSEQEQAELKALEAKYGAK